MFRSQWVVWFLLSSTVLAGNGATKKNSPHLAWRYEFEKGYAARETACTALPGGGSVMATLGNLPKSHFSVVVTRKDAEGKTIWTKQPLDRNYDAWHYPRGIAVGENGEIGIAGHAEVFNDEDNSYLTGFLIRIDKNGDLMKDVIVDYDVAAFHAVSAFPGGGWVVAGQTGAQARARFAIVQRVGGGVRNWSYRASLSEGESRSKAVSASVDSEFRTLCLIAGLRGDKKGWSPRVVRFGPRGKMLTNLRLDIDVGNPTQLLEGHDLFYVIGDGGRSKPPRAVCIDTKGRVKWGSGLTRAGDRARAPAATVGTDGNLVLAYLNATTKKVVVEQYNSFGGKLYEGTLDPTVIAEPVSLDQTKDGFFVLAGNVVRNHGVDGKSRAPVMLKFFGPHMCPKKTKI
ncbi:MAG: hypothetical protein AAF517_01985 [Planctomycetota bacterium]